MVATGGEVEVDAMVAALMMLMRDGAEHPVEVLLAIVLVLLAVPDSVPTVDDVVKVLAEPVALLVARLMLLESELLVVVGVRTVLKLLNVTVEPVVRVLVGVLAKVDAGCLIRPHTLLLVDIDSGA